MIREYVGSIPFTVMPLDEAIDLVLTSSSNSSNRDARGLAIHFCNAYNVALARTEIGYREVLEQGDIIFSDGVPITWVGKRVRPDLTKQWERVYGPDVMSGVLEQSSTDGPRHYLLGGTPDVLQELQSMVSTRYPDARIVGAESPPFRTPTAAELQERDQRIFESGADIVWVGLGTPKQDYEVARLAARLPVTAIAVGAAFDFLAGTKPQAPTWMQRSGTEWLFRFASEPRRLAKRYLWGNSVFLIEAGSTLQRKR